ncbi:2-alkenal reductase (NADP(+)-dependent)-like, partial [Camellia sinensis]|uniref:2-alkenal reductase (NADP(+)-dependent)-like n=1 Tax=Camellia sinensis TaxID=4442 RepID=UPI001035DF73
QRKLHISTKTNNSGTKIFLEVLRNDQEILKHQQTISKIYKVIQWPHKSNVIMKNYKIEEEFRREKSKALTLLLAEVELLKEKLGFDDAFNYKEETDLKSTLKRYFPDGIDIYFDNVGADMLEAAVSNMNLFGRVAACGVISQYTDVTKRAAPDMIDVVYKRITIQGFLSTDYMNVYADFLSTTADHLRNGKMKVLEDISHGVESIPTAFMALFSGDNIGKKIVQITADV